MLSWEWISWMAYRVLVWLCVDDVRRFLGHGFPRLVWLFPSKVRGKPFGIVTYINRCSVFSIFKIDVICNEINNLLDQKRFSLLNGSLMTPYRLFGVITGLQRLTWSKILKKKKTSLFISIAFDSYLFKIKFFLQIVRNSIDIKRYAITEKCPCSILCRNVCLY